MALPVEAATLRSPAKVGVSVLFVYSRMNARRRTRRVPLVAIARWMEEWKDEATETEAEKER